MPRVSVIRTMATTRPHLALFAAVLLCSGPLLAELGDPPPDKAEAAEGKVLRAGVGSWATLKGHARGINSLAYAPNGKLLATGSSDHTAKLWDIGAGKAVATLKHEREVSAVAFSPDGTLLATGDGRWQLREPGEVRVWDVATAAERRVLRGHRGGVLALAFGPGGLLVSGGRDATVRLWDVRSGRSKFVLRADSDERVRTVAVSPDGRLIASGGAPNGFGVREVPIRLWDVASGKERATLRGHTFDVWGLAFAPDGKVLASGGIDGTVRLWEVTTSKLKHTFLGAVPEGDRAVVWSVAYRPDGKMIATGDLRGNVRLWDPHGQKILASVKGYPTAVCAVAFSPDSKVLAVGTGFVDLQDTELPGEVHLWKVASFEE
jgi:WD40 repeat protein